MNSRITAILEQLQKLETELEGELQKGRVLRGLRIIGRRVTFDKETRLGQSEWRIALIPFLKGTTLLTLVTAPLIYSMIVPFVLLDAWVTLYQEVYFRSVHISRVTRSDYIVFDRQHLAYLNSLQALNCLYCGYANGVIAYTREIASRTEQYWCPIKHALRIRDPHQRYQQFLEYGDAQGFRSRLSEYRKQLQEPPEKTVR